jgi:hypothetical protein
VGAAGADDLGVHRVPDEAVRPARPDPGVTPTLKYTAPKYAWLNSGQCIGKLVAYPAASYVKYHIFVLL